MDARTQANIQRLAKQRAQVDPLPAAAVPKQILAATALGRDSPASASGSGIAGPLTEPSYTNRLWHPAKTLTSSDGFFVFQTRCVKRITMTDINSTSLELNFSDSP